MKAYALLLATLTLALFATGCSQSSPAGVYTYSRASGFYTQNLGGIDEGVTFNLDLRSDGSYASTVQGGPYMRGKGDIPAGSGTWSVRDGSVVLSSGARLRVEGLDLIHPDGVRYQRIR